MSKQFYKWDKHSDQPFPIEDRAYKKQVRIRSIPAFLKLILSNILVLPFITWRYFISPIYNLPKSSEGFIGLCINLDKHPEETETFVRELGVTSLAIRIPMSDVENLDKYIAFASKFSSSDLLFVVLQDREHVEDKVLREKSLLAIFEGLNGLSDKFQIGNAINRTKWAFNSIDEYLLFFKSAYQVKQDNNLKIKLYGPSVIDFEFYGVVRSLFNFFPIKFHGFSSLLYVDRRGAPESFQLNFDLPRKILLFKSMMNLSSKVGDDFFITETNWPIEDTAPYAPALHDVWVSEEKYANYLSRYYLLALASGLVNKVYWHQLISPGYGLIDDRDGKIRKRRAYYNLRALVSFFSDVSVKSMSVKGSRYEIRAETKEGNNLIALWLSGGKQHENVPADSLVFDSKGEPIDTSTVEIGESVIYFVQK